MNEDASTPDAEALACLPDCSGTDLQGADLYAANLKEASFVDANLSKADLSNAHLDGADLRGVNFKGATLTSASLRGAELSGADLTEAWAYGADLAGAILRGVEFNGATLQNANLAGADLSGADMTDSDLRGAYLDGIDLAGVWGCDRSGRLPGCVGSGEISWAFEDGCKDGYTIEVRIFDRTSKIVVGPPEPNSSYLVEESLTIGLPCTAGSKYCYGAQSTNQSSDLNATTYSWGLGIEADRSCDACCVPCEAGERLERFYRLKC